MFGLFCLVCFDFRVLNVMVNISETNISEAAQIRNLAEESFLHAHGKSASQKDIDQFISNHYQLHHFEEDIKREENLYHSFYLDNELIGYSKIVLNTGYKKPFDGYCKLDRIYFLPQHFGKGYAKQLLDFNIALAQTKNQLHLWLYVWVENHRAIGFYKKQGFNIVGEYNFQISPSHSNPNHIMQLNLS